MGGTVMPKEGIVGYNGKILRVNLSQKTTAAEELDPMLCRRYIGGAGFIAYYLWKELKPGIDPLSPDNKLIFSLGPISGLQLPGAARHSVGAKSPLTGTIAKAESGGFWSAELKRAGYDVIIVEGKADKPVYLWIQDGEACIKDAERLWGKETKETQEAIRTELGDDRIQVALIGPAGEKMVRYACIMHGLHDAAARGGVGAVMGSKNLKAIAVRGHKLPKIADSEKIKEIRQRVVGQLEGHWLKECGTGGDDMAILETIGNLPVRNFRDGLFPEVEQIHAGVMMATMGVGMEGCYACPIRCKKMLHFDKPYRVDAAYGGPEYETIASLGSDCGITNIKAVVRANERCGAYSLDTISMGGTLAFAMECFEKGLLTKKDTGGIELRFGNDEAMLRAIDLTARREGIGNMLAEGVARMAKKIGRGSSAFSMHVKGLESGMHDPRVSAGLGLGYMVNPNGADHCTNMLDMRYAEGPAVRDLHHLGIIEPLPPDDISGRKIDAFRLLHCKKIMDDCTAVCVFLEYDMDTQAQLVKAATGWETGAIELMRVAERVLTTARLFNIREGFSADDDLLPERFFQPKTDGVLSGEISLNRAEMEKAKRHYYNLMGWDENGVPLPERVEELYIQ
jgi:aldehyde:ferredoxin oxidoreductase